MPTYEFHCHSCTHHFEKFLKIADREQPTHEPCPECGETNVHKELSPTPMSYGVFGVGSLRTSSGWRDVISKIRSNNPYNKIDGEITP